MNKHRIIANFTVGFFTVMAASSFFDGENWGLKFLQSCVGGIIQGGLSAALEYKNEAYAKSERNARKNPINGIPPMWLLF